jgi:hypothetical protein
VTWHITIGRLGHQAATTLDYPRDEYPVAFVDGGLVAIARPVGKRTIIDVVRASDGVRVGGMESNPPVISGDPRVVQLDATRRLIYASVVRTDGQVAIVRSTFDGDVTTLLTLDDRFAEEPFPGSRFGMTITERGELVVEACVEDDVCRVWAISPDDRAASTPLTLAKSTPTVCSVIAADDRLVIVSDDFLCEIDYAPAPFPMRAISRSDGSNHRFSNADDVAADRVMRIGGKEVVIASQRTGDWSTTRVWRIDPLTDRRTLLADALPNSTNGLDGWLQVVHRRFVGDWVLIEPWGVDGTTTPVLPDARFLDVVTGQLIELPPGTFGWF